MPRSALESNLMMLSHIGNRNESHNKNVQRVGHRKINEYFQLYSLHPALCHCRYRSLFPYPFLFLSFDESLSSCKKVSACECMLSQLRKSYEHFVSLSQESYGRTRFSKHSVIGDVFFPSVLFSSIFFAYSFISFTFHTINFMCLNS